MFCRSRIDIDPQGDPLLLAPLEARHHGLWLYPASRAPSSPLSYPATWTKSILYQLLPVNHDVYQESVPCRRGDARRMLGNRNQKLVVGEYRQFSMFPIALHAFEAIWKPIWQSKINGFVEVQLGKSTISVLRLYPENKSHTP